MGPLRLNVVLLSMLRYILEEVVNTTTKNLVNNLKCTILSVFLFLHCYMYIFLCEDCQGLKKLIAT